MSSSNSKHIAQGWVGVGKDSGAVCVKYQQTSPAAIKTFRQLTMFQLGASFYRLKCTLLKKPNVDNRERLDLLRVHCGKWWRITPFVLSLYNT